MCIILLVESHDYLEGVFDFAFRYRVIVFVIAIYFNQGLTIMAYLLSIVYKTKSSYLVSDLIIKTVFTTKTKRFIWEFVHCCGNYLLYSQGGYYWSLKIPYIITHHLLPKSLCKSFSISQDFKTVISLPYYYLFIGLTDCFYRIITSDFLLFFIYSQWLATSAASAIGRFE